MSGEFTDTGTPATLRLRLSRKESTSGFTRTSWACEVAYRVASTSIEQAHDDRTRRGFDIDLRTVRRLALKLGEQGLKARDALVGRFRCRCPELLACWFEVGATPERQVTAFTDSSIST